MRILLIGSGGREHALAWAMVKSPRLDALFVAPGNGGTQEVATNVALDARDHGAVIAFCKDEHIDLVVVGPEAPLVAGITDALTKAGIAVFGPSKAAARLEGSKLFTKELCEEAGIPTADYASFSTPAPALAYLRQHPLPVVIKADGLASGKGVTVAQTMEEARKAVEGYFAQHASQSNALLLIEQCLDGQEASLFAISDGSDIVMLPTVQDHKRVGAGDTGPNTGGMGAYSPAPVMTEAMLEQARRDIIAPAIATMAERGTPFVGVLFAGVMVTQEGPKLIEFNARFGDPECQVLMARLQSDVLDLLEGATTGALSRARPRFCDEPALGVVLAAKGYPGPYGTGSTIGGLDSAQGEGVVVFHAGTRRDGETLSADGGRVLCVTALGADLAAAREAAYRGVDTIAWSQGFCRRDIGWRALGPRD